MFEISTDELQKDSQSQKEAQKTLSLEEVTALCSRMVVLEDQISVMEQELSDKKQELHNLAEGTIPEALNNIGLKSMTLQDGSVIGCKDYISCSITETNRQQAHSWLRDNGYDDLIKNEVVVSFGQGEDNDAKNLLNTISEEIQRGELHCGGVLQNERVHPSTLKAFLKEQLKAGAAVPAAYFNLTVGQVAFRQKAKRAK